MSANTEREDHEPLDTGTAGIAASLVAAGITHPSVAPAPVSDLGVLLQQRDFLESVRQSGPLAKPGSASASELVRVVRDGSAMRNGISPDAAERCVTTPRSPADFLKGSHPKGRLAEVVAASDYRELHAGRDPGIVNPPARVASNVSDIRLSPHHASRKDLIFAFEADGGELIWKHNGQVKTGRAQYISDSLVKMSQTPGYGKIGYVDARYVAPDGAPRVAPNAFTEAQARKLKGAGVRLRGIRDLDRRSSSLGQNLRAHGKDDLSPAVRADIQQLREEISAAYRPRGVATRVMGGAAMAASTAAVLSLVIQILTEGKVDVRAVGNAAGTSAAFGASGALADAGLYHLAKNSMGMSEEAAKSFAQQGVAVGFCVVAIGVDLVSEFRAAKRGEVTAAGAICGSAAKIALDLLPLVMAPLGIAGIPVLIVSQIGGRWLIARVREADRTLENAITKDKEQATNMMARMAAFTTSCELTHAESAETDDVFRRAMAGA